MSLVSGRPVLALLVLGLALVACSPGSAAPTPSPSLRPTPSPTPSRQPTPAPAGVVVTFDVEGEEYRIQLTDPADIDVARRLLAGEEAPGIPNGLIVRGDASVNTGYSWHIDPDSVEFVDATIEICDGLPSHVEDGTLEGDRYCPWGAEVVAVEPAE